jgi:hypothetical protein
VLFLLPLALVALGIGIERADLFSRLRSSVQRLPETLPSTTSVPPEEIVRGVPLLSVFVEPHDLYDADTGLLANKLMQGSAWERHGWMSYFDHGRLRFASDVGVRVHGGISRTISPVPSFRLYFRRKYGARRPAPGLFFDASADPVRSVVLHNDLRADSFNRYWQFLNPLAYDIARAAGAFAPQTKPVRVLLNGTVLGVYALTEDLNDSQYLYAHYGHANFDQSTRSYRRLLNDLKAEEPLTMEKVAEVVDLDNLTRWFLSILFCATEDMYQGLQLRDTTTPEARWFWISWDMDHSFMDHNRRAPADAPWEHDTFQWMMERIEEDRGGRFVYPEPRPFIFTTLIADPAYQEYFKQRFTEVMNHRITSTFLDERFAHYAHIAQTYGVQDLEYLDVLRGFLTHRPAALRNLAEQYLNTGPSVRYRLIAPRTARLTVDGMPVKSEYEGYYFPGMTIEAAVAPEDRAAFSHWRVNAERLTDAGPTLRVRVDTNLEIEAVFR